MVLSENSEYPQIQWIGLRDNLQETIDFPIFPFNMGLSCKFALKPIHSQMALKQKEHIGIGGYMYPIFRLAHLKYMSLLAEPTSAKQNTGSDWEPPCLTNWSKFYCYPLVMTNIAIENCHL